MAMHSESRQPSNSSLPPSPAPSQYHWSLELATTSAVDTDHLIRLPGALNPTSSDLPAGAMTSHLSCLSLVITIRDNGRSSHLLPLELQIGSPQEARDANLLVLFIMGVTPRHSPTWIPPDRGMPGELNQRDRACPVLAPSKLANTGPGAVGCCPAAEQVQRHLWEPLAVAQPQCGA